MSKRMIHMVCAGIPGMGVEAHLFEQHNERDEFAEHLQEASDKIGANARITRKDFLVPFDASSKDVADGVSRALQRAVLQHALSQALG